MKKSNLYIEKIYSDHPISCWALDDEISYRQLLSQDPYAWGCTGNGQFDTTSDKKVAPVLDDAFFGKLNITDDAEVFYWQYLFGLDLDPSLEEITFSMWVHHPSSVVTKYEIGFRDNLNNIDYFSEFFPIEHKWHHIFDTVSTSLITSDFEVYLKIYSDGAETVYINAPSLGQNSEEYCSYSIGYLTASPQTTLMLDEYGRNTENNGSYTLDNYYRVSVREGSIPLAFGSYHSTYVDSDINGSGIPIKFPGSGFLHENGKHKNYTFEMWARLVNASSAPVKIFGPVSSTDGLYVEEGFISVYIGPYTQSYFVGKWYRPMLIHFEYTPTMVFLFINGERVISIDIDIDKIPFATGSTLLGIYASDLVSPYEIDSLALYPYAMPTETAKKHFVYGQGVQDFDFSNEKFLKKTVQVDFPYAQYAYNVIYPDTNKWRSGYSLNLDTSSTYIKPATYPLPEVLVESGGSLVNTDQWFLDNHDINIANSDIAPHVKMLPGVGYDSASIYYKNLSIMNDRAEAIFGVFKAPVAAAPNQEVMRFVNKQTGESFRITLNNQDLTYAFFDRSGVQVGADLIVDTVLPEKYFYAGLKIADVARLNYSTVGIFFSDYSKLSLTIGGSSGNTFGGKVFTINFVDRNIYNRDFKNSGRFVNGLIVQDDGVPTLINYIGTYTLVALISNTSMIFDVGTTGYWEDSLPLSMFGKNVISGAGKLYDLDIIQFNIDAQYKQIYKQNDFVPYGIFEAILHTFLETYVDIDNYYNSYDEMYADIYDIYQNFRIDTGIKTYVTLQHFSQIGIKPYSDYINSVPAAVNNVVEFNTATLDTTKYEVYDNYTIIIPKNIDFNDYYITLHLDTRVRGSMTKNMVIKRCELSSFVFNDGVDTKIGTKRSLPLVPFAEVLP